VTGTGLALNGTFNALATERFINATNRLLALNARLA
jgi:hypothetical protein